MIGILKESDFARILENHDRANVSFHGETAMVEGVPSGVVVILPGPKTEGYLPSDKRLPLQLDNEVSLDVVGSPPPDPYLEPML